MAHEGKALAEGLPAQQVKAGMKSRSTSQAQRFFSYWLSWARSSDTSQYRTPMTSRTGSAIYQPPFQFPVHPPNSPEVLTQLEPFPMFRRTPRRHC